MLTLARSTHFVRVLAVAALALALAGCTGAAGVSGPVSPPASVAVIASATPIALPSTSPQPTASVEPEEDEVEDEDDEESPTPKPTPVPGCGTGESAFHEHTGEVNRLLSFGDSEVELATAGIAMRDDSYLADDVIPYYAGLKEDQEVVRVGSGERVLLTGDGMTLADATTTFARWSDIEFVKDQLPSLAGPRTEDVTTQSTDGTVSITAPEKPGDYLVDLWVHWQTACLKGDGVAYGRLKVS
jgi:hypothetical protein